MKDKLEEEHPNEMKEAGIEIPSQAWVEYQFAPVNYGYKAALAYTGMMCSCDVAIAL